MTGRHNAPKLLKQHVKTPLKTYACRIFYKIAPTRSLINSLGINSIVYRKLRLPHHFWKLWVICNKKYDKFLPYLYLQYLHCHYILYCIVPIFALLLRSPNVPAKRLNVTSSSIRPRRGWLSRSIPGESMAIIWSLPGFVIKSTSGSNSEVSSFDNVTDTGCNICDGDGFVPIDKSTSASVSTRAAALVQLFWLWYSR